MSFTAWVVGEVIGATALSGILGMLIVPTLRRVVLPKFEETYLSDFLPFYHIEEDQKTLVCRTEALVRIIELKGVDIQTTTSDEQHYYFSRKQAFFDAMAERGGFFRIITRREKVSTEDRAYFDHEVLQRIHDKWQAQFQHCYQTTHYLLIQSKKQSELEDFTTVALEHLSAFKPEILGNREEMEGTTSSPAISKEISSPQLPNLKRNWVKKAEESPKESVWDERLIQEWSSDLGSSSVRHKIDDVIKTCEKNRGDDK